MPMLNKIHAYVGLALLLPLFVWAVTGFIFLLKPGYKKAYEQLDIAQAPYFETIRVEPKKHWQQLTFLHSVLGAHLLVTTTTREFLHLDPRSLQPWPHPTEQQVARLIEAATKHDSERYGEVADVEQEGDHFRITTNTKVELHLDWKTLKLLQSGDDTRFIDRLYRLHYLQWSPAPKLNHVLALLALVGLLIMCAVGLRMLISFHHKE